MAFEGATDDKPERSFIEAARRTQIVECAIETIAEVGYINASLAQIAQRAGISKGVISYHFASKEELVREVVGEVYNLAGQFMRPRIAAETTARSRLRVYIESNLEFMGVYRKQLLALVNILLNARTTDGKMLFGVNPLDPAIAGTEAIFLDGQKAGEFSEFSARDMAIALRGAIDAALGRLMAEPDFDPARYARELVRLFDLGTRRAE